MRLTVFWLLFWVYSYVFVVHFENNEQYFTVIVSNKSLKVYRKLGKKLNSTKIFRTQQKILLKKMSYHSNVGWVAITLCSCEDVCVRAYMGGETWPDGRQDIASGSPLCIIYSLIALLGNHHYLSVSVQSSFHVILVRCRVELHKVL